MTTSSATQDALSNHLVLTNIFSALSNSEEESIYYENDIYGKTLPDGDHYLSAHAALLRCSLVNHSWWLHAVPFLWRDLTPEHYQEWSISDILSTMPSEDGNTTDPSRRQFHANFIEIGTDYNKGELSTFTGYAHNDKRDEVLEALKFPKLKTLTVQHRRPSGRGGLPEIDHVSAPSLVEIIWTVPFYDMFGDEYVYSDPQYDMRCTLMDIQRKFPRVEVVRIVGERTGAFPGDLERFKRKMECLRVFEHGLVSEVDGFRYPWSKDQEIETW